MRRKCDCPECSGPFLKRVVRKIVRTIFKPIFLCCFAFALFLAWLLFLLYAEVRTPRQASPGSALSSPVVTGDELYVYCQEHGIRVRLERLPNGDYCATTGDAYADEHRYHIKCDADPTEAKKEVLDDLVHNRPGENESTTIYDSEQKQ